MTIQEAEAELASIAEQMRPLAQRSEQLTRTLRSLRSKEFIRVNQITLADVENSRRDGEFFGNVWVFAERLKQQPGVLRFAEWNKQLHYTADLLSGKWSPTPAWMDDVPKN